MHFDDIGFHCKYTYDMVQMNTVMFVYFWVMKNIIFIELVVYLNIV